jgi:tRNA pseudouridine38-40 synthase
MANYLVKASYLGSGFHGSQRQKNLVTAMSALESALSKICGEKIQVKPCSRLDKGVSAEDWGASFACQKELTGDKAVYALNRLLEPNMHIKGLFIVQEGRDARHACVKKTYVYRLNFGEADPLNDLLVWRPFYRGDEELFKKAMSLFKGEHDFSSFFSLDKGEEEKPYKEIETIEFSSQEPYLKVKCVGKAFGRYQVRFMVGAAFEVSCGRLPIEEISLRLAGQKKGLLRFKAPANGLVLEKTEYEEGFIIKNA